MDSKAYNTEGREAQFIQINQVIEKLTENKKSHGRHNQESRVQLQARLKTIDRKIQHRRRTEPGQRCDATSRKKYGPRILPTSLREIIKQVGNNLQRRPHNRAHRTKKKIIRHTALRTCRINEDASRIQNVLVAEYVQRDRG